MFTRRSFVEKILAVSTLPALVSTGARGAAFSGSGNRSEAEDLKAIQRLLAGKEPLKWVFAGDSITQGAKHTFGYRSYPEIFAERVRWELRRVRDLIINSAISGNTSADILNDYEWRIGQFKPAVVSVFVGTNDSAVSRQISPEKFRQNLDAIINNLRAGGAIPILHTPSIVITEKAVGRESLPEYVRTIRELAAEKGVILVDNWDYWQKTAIESPEADLYRVWLNDELHPNGKGHLEIAQLLFKKLSIFDPQSFTGGSAPFK